MTGRLLAADAGTAELVDQSARPLATVGGAEVGLWEMAPGTTLDTEVDEVFAVLSGAGTVRFLDTGERLDLRPGAVVRLHAGERTEWTVTETLRKVYVAG